MSRDIFDDRLGFAAARHAFVMKRPPGTSSSTGRRPTPSGSSPEDRPLRTRRIGSSPLGCCRSSVSARYQVNYLT